MSFYVPDKTKTAMEEQAEWMSRSRVICPCEWWASWGDYPDYQNFALPALRFHFDHCPQARVAPIERAEP